MNSEKVNLTSHEAQMAIAEIKEKISELDRRIEQGKEYVLNWQSSNSDQVKLSELNKKLSAMAEKKRILSERLIAAEQSTLDAPRQDAVENLKRKISGVTSTLDRRSPEFVEFVDNIKSLAEKFSKTDLRTRVRYYSSALEIIGKLHFVAALIWLGFLLDSFLKDMPKEVRFVHVFSYSILLIVSLIHGALWFGSSFVVDLLLEIHQNNVYATSANSTSVPITPDECVQ